MKDSAVLLLLLGIACAQQCGRGNWKCNNGHCIPLNCLCDGSNDCGDQSDEIGCPCDDDEFSCSWDFCIPSRYVCDGENDCIDWSDEYHCPDCPGHECPQSKRCISQRKICDGKVDCPDGSDETEDACHEVATTEASTKAPSSETTKLLTTSTPLETTPALSTTDITKSSTTTEPSLQTTTDPFQKTEINIQRDIPNNGQWSFDCATGYADAPSSFSCQAGSVNIPPENLDEGFWTKCGFRCWIDYAVQPSDRLYKARIFQKNIMTEVIYDRQRSEFIPGSGWVNWSIPLNGVKSIGLRLDHMAPDVFTLLDKITIEAESE